MKKIISALCATIIFHTSVYAIDMSAWALDEYQAASGAGLLSYNVVKNNLKEDITRSEFSELAVNLYESLSKEEVSVPEEVPFKDTVNEDVLKAYALGIVSGRSETEFAPFDNITREEMAIMLVNTLKSSGETIVTLTSEAEEVYSWFEDSDKVSSWAYGGVAAALKYTLISGYSETELAPKDSASREQAVAMINRAYSQFAKKKTSYVIPKLSVPTGNLKIKEGTSLRILPVNGGVEYFIIIKDSNGAPVKTYKKNSNVIGIGTALLKDNAEYSITWGVEYKSGITVFSEPSKFTYNGPKEIIEEDEPKDENIPEKEPEDEKTEAPQYPEKEPQNVATTLSQKEQRVFPGGTYFASENEAKSNMTEVTVNVWVINSKGEKVARTKEITVNQYLAEDVVNIFNEIFNDPSQFPIKSVGGYCWRMSAMGKISQHSYGTCIDINPDENYYCYAADGTAITGTHWSPYEDEYSITPDGIVVKTFEKYGWVWGGSWNGTVKDYMHFSYLGK